MKIHRLSILTILVLCSSCVRNIPALQSNDDAQSINECPIYDSKNWHAWFDQVNPSTGTGRLNISGEVDLPSPGFTTDFTLGPLDRRNPPSQIINLSMNRPEGPTIQVITTDTIRHSIVTNILRYRSITITCGDRQLAKMVDVIPSE